MKWIVLVLVLANVSLYLWVKNNAVSSPEYVLVDELDTSTKGMELVHELSGLRDTKEKETYECMRIGPFSTADTFSRASRSLINEGFGFTRNVVRARQLRTFRVYLGPFTTQAAKETARRRLEEEKLSYFEHADKEGELLTVGDLFSEGEAAGAYVAELKDVGFDAKARSEARTLGPWRWLEVADIVNEDRRITLREIDWVDAKARVTDVPCP